MISATLRSQKTELMDGDDFSPEEYAQCLREIERINRLTNGYGPTCQALEFFIQRRRDISRPLRVLDIGCGYGDTIRALARWARDRGHAIELHGLDIQPQAIALARDATPQAKQIQFYAEDIFEHRPKADYDVVLNALFLHHLDDQQIVRLLGWMAANSRLGFFVNDLHRHWFAYHFIGQATAAFRCNRLIRHDAPLSVARAFVADDWLKYARQANLSFADFDIRWHWPFRWGVRYAKPL